MDIAKIRRMGLDANQGGIMQSMIATFELDDFVLTRRSARPAGWRCMVASVPEEPKRSYPRPGSGHRFPPPAATSMSWGMPNMVPIASDASRPPSSPRGGNAQPSARQNTDCDQGSHCRRDRGNARAPTFFHEDVDRDRKPDSCSRHPAGFASGYACAIRQTWASGAQTSPVLSAIRGTSWVSRKLRPAVLRPLDCAPGGGCAAPGAFLRSIASELIVLRADRPRSR